MTKETASKAKRKPVMIYFDSNLLSKLDELCKRRGGRRSAFIQAIIGKALDSGNV